MPPICKLRSAQHNETPLNDPARQCIHDPGPYGPWCSRDRSGICLQRIPAEVV